MTELKWEQYGRNPGFVAEVTVKFSGPNGEKLAETNQQKMIKLIASENIFVIRQAIPGSNPISLVGNANGFDNAKELAVASVNFFVENKMQFNHEKQVPTIWGPAHGGTLGKL